MCCWRRHKIHIDAHGQNILKIEWFLEEISSGVNWQMVQKSTKLVKNLCQLFTHAMVNDAPRLAESQDILLRHHENRSSGEYSSALNTTAMEINWMSTMPSMMGMSKN